MKILLSSLPLLVGVISFFIVVGPKALHPSNIAWLNSGDPATHYLGWVFFRDSPWTFPIGLNPRYGLELSNSILYSDSNPLFALLFKPFSTLLPSPFQYFGIWLFLCFCLQAWFGWKLVGLISSNILIRLFGSSLFVFSPPMLYRLNGHLSLVGHFLIISALYLALNAKLEKRRLAWGGLLILASSVHGYLLVMVALVWITDLCGQLIEKKMLRSKAAIEFLLLIFAIGFSCWQFGYFNALGGEAAEGFGIYRMNLVSIFDSSGWSYYFFDFPGTLGEFEGFNYLGLGVIFLLVLAVPAMIKGWVDWVRIVLDRKHLLILFVVLFLFSLSNKIGFLFLEYEYYMPTVLLQVANIFRASGRMFWPVFYVIVFFIIFILSRVYETRTVVSLLAISLVIQVLDTSVAWLDIRKKLMAAPNSEWSSSLRNPFWEQAATKYTKVRYIPVGNQSANWQQLASYAGRYAMATDAVYLARVGNLATQHARRKSVETLSTGYFEQDSLYVLDDIHFHQAAITLDVTSDLLAKIDGFNVVAPGWKKCADCNSINGEINPIDIFPSFKLKKGERVEFNKFGTGGNCLGAGWSSPEEWGVWSDGTSAVMLLNIPPKEVASILIEAKALVSPIHNRQRVNLSINGVSAGNFTLFEPSVIFNVPIPELLKNKSGGEFLIIKFDFPDAVRPKDFGFGSDIRQLALGLVAVTVR